MINKRNKGISIVIILISFLSIQDISAQRFTSSPYSRFGIGELASQGSARNKAMGGAGIALNDSYYLNTLNPASFTSIDSTSFIFDLGVTGGFTEFKSDEGTETTKQGDFEYFSLGFAAKKWWGISAGIRKITNVGYDLDFYFTDKNTGNYTTQYEGSGGINKVYFANAFKLSKSLSLGINTNYNWGTVSTKESLEFEGNQGLPYYTVEELKVSNFNFDVGMQYNFKIDEKKEFNIGLTFGNQVELSGDYEIFSYSRNPYDTIPSKKKEANKIELPNRFGIGIAFNSRKLTLAADFDYQAWEDTATFNMSNTSISSRMKDSYGLALGIEYTPNKFSGRRFIDRVNYRAGAFYKNSNLEINDTQLKEYGLTAGLGLPIRGSYVNLAVELGTKGTTDNNLIEERFAKLSLSFTIYESWFQKILYD